MAKITATTDQDASIFDSIGPGIDPVPGPGFFLQGTAGNDYITGTSLADTILGLAGNDHLYGEDGDDIIDGGLGNDYLVGGRGADTLIGGFGIDTASYTTATAGVGVDLAMGGYQGDAYGDSYNGIENVVGSRFGDHLFGNDGSNRLDGGLGNDVIWGGAGSDVLIGGAGTDLLFGDYGPPSQDLFVISLEGGGIYDQIADFQVGLDKIVLSGFDRSAFGNDHELAYGDLFGESPNPNAFNLDVSDKLYFDRATEKLYAIDVQMIDGHLNIVSYETIVQINLPRHGFLPQADDFLFV